MRALLRGDCADDQIAAAVSHIWQARTDRYSELRAALLADTDPADSALSRLLSKRVEMSYIGE
jgi:cyclic pyranopterin phosphate synthase